MICHPDGSTRGNPVPSELGRGEEGRGTIFVAVEVFAPGGHKLSATVLYLVSGQREEQLRARDPTRVVPRPSEMSNWLNLRSKKEEMQRSTPLIPAWRRERGESEIQGHPQPQIKVGASLGHMMPSQKTDRKKGRGGKKKGGMHGK